MKTWAHPGGKLVELGAKALSQDELFAIIIGTGYKGRSAEDIAKELLDNYFSVYGLLGRTFSDLLKINGIKNGKVRRIAAVFEITKRIIKEQNLNLPDSRKITFVLPQLSDAELLAVLIVNGYKDKSPIDLADALLRKYGSLNGLMGTRLSDWAKIKGLGDVKIIRIAAAYELMLRLIKGLRGENPF
jgi:DNA repair protein RadC